MLVMNKIGLWDSRGLRLVSSLGTLIAKEMNTFGVVATVENVNAADIACKIRFPNAANRSWEMRLHGKEFSSWLLDYLIENNL